jgi:archaellum biogenesis ATPase FlaH
MVTDVDSFLISRTIIKPEYFEDEFRKPVKYILEYSDQHRAMPPMSLVKAATGRQIETLLPEEVGALANWYPETIEGFARHKALEIAILDSVTLLEKGEGGEVERLVKEAQSISLMKDLGTSYFQDPLARLERMRDRTAYISTGWPSLDKKLGGGFTRGALNVWAGGSGSGKSLWLQNIALNWVFEGLNVVYFSLELSEDLVAARLDAMVTARSTTEVFRNIRDTANAINLRSKEKGSTGKKTGELIVKKMPEAGTTANDIRAFLKEYEIKTGIKPDAIIIDYLDLMTPNGRNVDPSNLFTKDKYTSEEMRALAGEYNCLCVTASQLNRSAVEADEFDQSHIAGGISKINTADNVFAIFANKNHRENGKYELQFLKTRSSSAVGGKITLAYCPSSMRITCMGDGIEATIKPMTADMARIDLKTKIEAEKATGAAKPGFEAAPPAPKLDPTRSAVMGLMAKINKAGKANES